MTVFQFEARPFRRLSDEPDLDLTGVARVSLELPLGADVPAEDDPIGWFVREDPSPSALAPIGGAVIDMATNPRLEPALGYFGAEQVVLGRLEVTESLDEC